MTKFEIIWFLIQVCTKMIKLMVWIHTKIYSSNLDSTFYLILIQIHYREGNEWLYSVSALISPIRGIDMHVEIGIHVFKGISLPSLAGCQSFIFFS